MALTSICDGFEPAQPHGPEFRVGSAPSPLFGGLRVDLSTLSVRAFGVALSRADETLPLAFRALQGFRVYL